MQGTLCEKLRCDSARGGQPPSTLLLPVRSRSPAMRVYVCWRMTGSGWRCGSWGRRCCTTWCCCRCTRWRTGRSCGRSAGDRSAARGELVRPGAGRAVRAAPAGVVPADQRAGGGPLRSVGDRPVRRRLPRPLAADHGRAVRRLGAAAGRCGCAGRRNSGRRPSTDRRRASPRPRRVPQQRRGAEPGPGERGAGVAPGVGDRARRGRRRARRRPSAPSPRSAARRARGAGPSGRAGRPGRRRCRRCRR